MSNVQAKIDYEYKVSGAQQAANQMKQVGDGGKEASDGLKKATTASAQASEGLGDLVIKFVSLAAVIAAARKAVDIFADSVSMAIDANEDMNKFLVVMGASASEVDEELTQFADTTNRNVYELRALAAGVQDMLVPMGVARDIAAGMSTDFVKLATDMGSFNNVPVAETLAAIQSGLAGSSRPLRRFGVDTRVAALEAQAMAMGIHASWQEMTQAEQSAVLYAKIVKDTSDAQGDAARTADQAANLIVGFKSAIAEAQVAIGDNFLPVIEELVPLLKNELANALPIFQQISERIVLDLQRYGPLILNTFGKLIEVVAFLVDHFEELEKAARLAGGPLVYFLAEGIELVADRSIEARDNVSLFNGALKGLEDTTVRNRAENYEYAASIKDVTAEQIELNQQIGKAINLYQMDTVAKIQMAQATSTAAIAELRLLDAVMGGFGTFDAQIAGIEEYIDKLQFLAKTMDRGAFVPEVVEGGISTGGAGRDRVENQEQINTLKSEEILLERDLVAETIARLEMESQMKDTMFAKGQERRAAELEQVQAQMDPLISAAQRSTDIIVSGLTGGFDSIKAGFKNMLMDMAAEWAKSQIMKLLFSTGAKAATGGAGFFL